ncbi:MAG: TlpA family protein disulfide reductase [Geodermatophilaceae bacterium]
MVRCRAILRLAGLLALMAVALVGCQATTDDALAISAAGDSVAPPTAEHTATAVRGVASCAELPQESGTTAPAADRLPTLQLPCLTPGPDIDLAALRGRPVLINLWASWCVPCREEMPLLQAAHERYGEQVQFLGVDTMDSADLAADFLVETGVTYPQLVDVDGDLLHHLRIPGLPVTVVLDADGRVATKHIGELSTESIDNLLTGLH